MLEKSCRCGKSKKNFKIDIGPFFIADCCIEAGYDHLGNRPELKVEDLGLNQDEVQKAIDSAHNLNVDDEGEKPDPNEEIQEARLVTDPEELQRIEDAEIVKSTNVVQTFDGKVLSETDNTEEAKKEQLEKKAKRPYNRNGKIKVQP